MPETETIAGDLSEQYQQGRSRLWYWREVTVAMLTGTWSEVKQHGLLLFVAVAMAWIISLVWHWLQIGRTGHNTVGSTRRRTAYWRAEALDLLK